MADHVVVLSRGRVIADGATDQIRADHADLEEAYFHLVDEVERI